MEFKGLGELADTIDEGSLSTVEELERCAGNGALMAFLEKNRCLLKQVKTVKLCYDLLCNLEWIIDATDGVVGKFVDVPKEHLDHGRRLQPRLWELKYFGLVEPGDRKGLWALTQLGIDFFEGTELAPESVKVHDDKVISVKGRWNFVSALNYATR